MVRLKNRYLLVNILYPGLDNRPVDPKVPDVVVFNQPTTDSLTPHALVKGIKAEASNLFGDHGAGAIAESIAGKCASVEKGGVLMRWQSNTCHLLLRRSSYESRAHITGLFGRHCRS
jgi:ribonuclease P/MRP protein subunit POP5